MTRNRRTIISLFFVLLFFQNGFTICTANSAHNFESNKLMEEEINFFLKNIKLEVIDSESTNESIACFDVNTDGLIALGFYSSPNNIISIYDNSGEYLYGYAFTCSGSFGIKFSGTNISIYFARSNYIATFSPNGVCLGIDEITPAPVNNEIIDSYLYSTKKTVGDKVYNLERDFGLDRQQYSRLVVRDGYEREVIIYDITEEYNTAFSVIAISIISLVFILLYAVSKHILSLRSK